MIAACTVVHASELTFFLEWFCRLCIDVAPKIDRAIENLGGRHDELIACVSATLQCTLDTQLAVLKTVESRVGRQSTVRALHERGVATSYILGTDDALSRGVSVVSVAKLYITTE